MTRQFFFMMVVASFVILLHALFICVAVMRQWFGGKLPEMFKFPHLEIKLFIAISIGMLDVALGVLSQPRTAVGWKVNEHIILGIPTYHHHYYYYYYYHIFNSSIRFLCFISTHVYIYSVSLVWRS
jgi:hypothetical protein